MNIYKARLLGLYSPGLSARLSTSYYLHSDIQERLGLEGPGGKVWGKGRARKRAKRSDAFMIGILVTRSKIAKSAWRT